MFKSLLCNSFASKVLSAKAANTPIVNHLQKRNLLLYICNDTSLYDSKTINMQWNQAILDADGMGCDPAPHFRRVCYSFFSFFSCFLKYYDDYYVVLFKTKRSSQNGGE